MATQNLEYMGLAEFVAKLIGETFDAVLSSHEDQEMQRSEMLSLIDTDEETFAQNFVGDDEVHEILSELFPAEGAPGPHQIVAGGDYVSEVPGGTQVENPPLKTCVGVLFKEGEDYKDGKITPQGVDHVYGRVSLQIARKRLACLQEMAKKGVPRIVVDSGKILSKVSFKIEESVGPSDASAPPSDQRLQKTASLYRLHKKILPRTKMMIKQAKHVDSGSASTLYGEVEIKFRVI